MADMISDLSDAELDFVTGGFTVTGGNNAVQVSNNNSPNSNLQAGDNSTFNGRGRERERGNYRG